MSLLLERAYDVARCGGLGVVTAGSLNAEPSLGLLDSVDVQNCERELARDGEGLTASVPNMGKVGGGFAGVIMPSGAESV